MAAPLTVFAGPSLAGSALKSIHGACFRPPLCAGDLLREASRSLSSMTFLILDGEFGQSFAVSITEIREALHLGHFVLGAASMGALRAAEAGVLGMGGFGEIFEAFATGRLNRDDEVALTYDPESYVNLTVPLVNVRGLLNSLRSHGMSKEAASATFQRLSVLHFADRSFGRVAHELCSVGGLPLEQASALTSATGRYGWDQKRRDAEEAVLAFLRHGSAVFRNQSSFVASQQSLVHASEHEDWPCL